MAHEDNGTQDPFGLLNLFRNLFDPSRRPIDTGMPKSEAELALGDPRTGRQPGIPPVLTTALAPTVSTRIPSVYTQDWRVPSGATKKDTGTTSPPSDDDGKKTAPSLLNASTASDEEISRRIGELDSKFQNNELSDAEAGELEVLRQERLRREFPLTLLQSFLPSLLQLPLQQQQMQQEQAQFEAQQSQFAQQFAQQFGLDERQVQLSEQQELQRQQELQAQLQREQDARVQRGNVALALFPDISLPATVGQAGLSQETFNQLIQVAILRAQQQESERERVSRPPLLVNTLFG